MQQRALIIDDSIPIHRLIQAELDRDGIEFFSAYDGTTGIARAAELRPRVILLDVEMPEMDGFEVCRKLKANRQTAEIPIMFLTADAITADKIKGLDLGAVDYITKPFKTEELGARVRAAKRMGQRIEEQAMIDGVTGLWNKAYLCEHMSAQLSLANRTGRPLSCIVAQIDEFEQVSRKYGSLGKEEVLRTLAPVLLEQRRAEDAVCHYGEGRFVILVPSADRRAAYGRARRLCAFLKERKVKIKGEEIGATCSFGVADNSVAGEGSVLERADAALERAKGNGRAAVCVVRRVRRTPGYSQPAKKSRETTGV